MHSDKASQIDSNSMRFVAIGANGENVKHPGCLQEVVTWSEKCAIFKDSEALSAYHDTYPNLRTLSISSLFKHICQ